MDNPVAHELAQRDFADVSTDPGGATAVVLDALDRLDEVATRAPAAVLVVTREPLEESCEQVLARTLYARARVIGTEDPVAVVEAIVLDRGTELRCVANTGEGCATTLARVGRGGITAFI